MSTRPTTVSETTQCSNRSTNSSPDEDSNDTERIADCSARRAPRQTAKRFVSRRLRERGVDVWGIAVDGRESESMPAAAKRQSSEVTPLTGTRTRWCEVPTNACTRPDALRTRNNCSASYCKSATVLPSRAYANVIRSAIRTVRFTPLTIESTLYESADGLGPTRRRAD